jgi:XTP/dITP diphosphohydrolase
MTAGNVTDIVVGTGNSGKLREIRGLLDLPGVRLVGLREAGFDRRIEESGSSFLENALIKARAVHRRLGLPVIAEDSGLCVDALGGEPGVRSARFAGPGATDRENIRLLLRRLAGAGSGPRSARFVCAAVFLLDPGRWVHAEGTVGGVIIDRPRGEGGFGYDPVFLVPSLGKTMAELDPEGKNRISHRGRALRELRERMAALLGEMPGGS